ncbi:hypothetical protein TSUD_34960 [Trifolium subterraneum]|uniref:KNOX1 domain-containing protein n=1 Tax=Trifolium subterraneum TaxID=3900 RepID=A0A2Z6LW85_TRISU|nr:hypothetical protein TSUD_34960 [Trifolium subterraneum]
MLTIFAAELQHPGGGGGGVRGANNNNYLLEMDLIGSDISDRILKNQIATHPLYPNLLSAFIECQKFMNVLITT